MEIHPGDHREDWLRSAPDLGALILKTRDDRKGRPRDAAVVIPSYRNQKMLLEHLECLSHQTTTDFDIIIVYGQEDEFIRQPPWTGILHLRCRDLGSAGAFYAGERAALEEGYRKIILADDDCLPESRDLVEKIIGRLDQVDVVKPLVRHHPYPGYHPSVLYHYGGMRSQALAAAGLTFLPLRRGFDDLELESRMRGSGAAIGSVDAHASHPWYPPFVLLGRESRDLHYFGRGSILVQFLRKDWAGAYGAFFFRLMKASCCHVIGRLDLRDSFLEAARQESSGAFFDDGGRKGGANAKAVDSFEPSDPARDIIIRLDGSDGVASGRPGGRKDTLSGKISRLLELPGFFGKRVIFIESCIDWDLRVMVFAKCCYLKQGQAVFEVSKERGPASIALGALALLVSVPFIAIYSAFLTIRGGLEFRRRGITSERYGMPIQEDKSRHA